jgi:hypothetical protein
LALEASIEKHVPAFSSNDGPAGTIFKTQPEQTRFSCITPTAEQLREPSIISEVVESHSWKVEESNPHGDGFIVRMHCANCGLGRIFIIYNVEESAKKSKK